ncbi:hypothetical protein PQQ73_21855 [Paraburkholderia strydomiana]|uniref:Uncharacterized protein n=1 Tax=Paraburkholderia strydomiana TaxID=1245417 RepID=A0ABW9EIW1_9BURK
MFSNNSCARNARSFLSRLRLFGIASGGLIGHSRTHLAASLFSAQGERPSLHTIHS